MRCAMDAQRAPVHPSNRGALLRLCEAICDLCKFHVRDNVRLAFAGALARQDQIVGGGVSARHFRLSRHRDPALGGLSSCPGGVIASPLQWSRWVVERRHLPLPTGSCEQRWKHMNDPLLARMCQFFSRYFAATMSHGCACGPLAGPAGVSMVKSPAAAAQRLRSSSPPPA